jgi:hypothetical protein
MCLLECLSSDELGGEESSDWPSDKSSWKSKRPLNVAIIASESSAKRGQNCGPFELE